MRAILAALLLLWLAVPALAVNPDEMLGDPVLEQRARAISAGLRCLVCQNESIDDSDADLAKQIRIIVRQRLVGGDSDDQVRQYLVERYGEYVLLKPVLALHTLVLWAAAPTIIVIGAIVLVVAGRRRNRTVVTGGDAALTPEEQRILDELGRS